MPCFSEEKCESIWNKYKVSFSRVCQGFYNVKVKVTTKINREEDPRCYISNRTQRCLQVSAKIQKYQRRA